MRYKETQMKKILIYGTGMVADYFIDNHDFAGEELVGVIETGKLQNASRCALYSVTAALQTALPRSM